ncbi:MAG: NAD(+) synthase [Dysgonamonadaceae bacterium]|jgi:NAD+ synthase (glutamine-hydrolysing)|nr:NAD(+) synthase [Dysgonamonadaceae bacterium]
MVNFGFIRVAAAISELKVADCRFNAKRIKELLHQAVEKKVEIVCFPELSITGYTCGDLFLQNRIIEEAEETICGLINDTKNLPVTYIIGAPVRINNCLYNSAIVCSEGNIMGVVPKSFLPNNSEFYEKRWFNSSPKRYLKHICYAGCHVLFGTDQIFGAGNKKFAIEICEDLWAPIPVSSHHALAGANLIFNLSASNELTGKHEYLNSLIKQQSARCIAGYIYASAGWGESTTDVVFAGNGIIYENGILLARSERFKPGEQLVISEIDTDRLDNDRLRTCSFRDSIPDNDDYAEVEISLMEKMEYDENRNLEMEPLKLRRTINPFPFIPSDEQYDLSCMEIFSIQTFGLAKRIRHTNATTSVIGISGGLDSTLALLVCVNTCDKLGIPRNKIIGVTMPGFGTTDRTYNNAVLLMKSLGVTIREINIKAACEQHFKDIGHNPEKHDITYENSQARERTQILMDIANQADGLVIGTGDMSELALGWATYNGDHMSMYGVNSGVPKTLVRHLVKWFAETRTDEKTASILKDVLDTPVSPELIPSKNGKISQCTEEIVGPYELHDFFLYYTIRFGFTPEKIRYLAQQAFKGKYNTETISQWMKTFYKRFFSQQFKRSCIPDGPKVGSINLSPRGDWRMPSDASSALWTID